MSLPTEPLSRNGVVPVHERLGAKTTPRSGLAGGPYRNDIWICGEKARTCRWETQEGSLMALCVPLRASMRALELGGRSKGRCGRKRCSTLSDMFRHGHP